MPGYGRYEESDIEGMKEVAFRMLAAGKYALEEIVNISGLSLEEIEKLQTHLKV